MQKMVIIIHVNGALLHLKIGRESYFNGTSLGNENLFIIEDQSFRKGFVTRDPFLIRLQMKWQAGEADYSI